MASSTVGRGGHLRAGGRLAGRRWGGGCRAGVVVAAVGGGSARSVETPLLAPHAAVTTATTTAASRLRLTMPRWYGRFAPDVGFDPRVRSLSPVRMGPPRPPKDASDLAGVTLSRATIRRAWSFARPYRGDDHRLPRGHPRRRAARPGAAARRAGDPRHGHPGRRPGDDHLARRRSPCSPPSATPPCRSSSGGAAPASARA